MKAMFVIERNFLVDKFQELQKNLTAVLVVSGNRAEVFNYLIISDYYMVENGKIYSTQK